MKILSPAKINLFLQVTGKRPDGYHELFSLMCCVSLFDTIYLQFGTPNIEIESSHPNLPLDNANLAHRAAALFFQSLGVTDGVKIAIEKNTTLTAMVRDFLHFLARNNETMRKQSSEMLSQSFRSLGRDMGERTWTRDDLHERT